MAINFFPGQCCRTVGRAIFWNWNQPYMTESWSGRITHSREAVRCKHSVLDCSSWQTQSQSWWAQIMVTAGNCIHPCIFCWCIIFPVMIYHAQDAFWPIFFIELVVRTYGVDSCVTGRISIINTIVHIYASIKRRNAKWFEKCSH